jgi:hypothetical protein
MAWKLASSILAVLAVLALPVRAHHSFVMFDTAKQVTIKGTVTDFQWTNPHAYIEMDVKDDAGATKHWSVELGSPSILQQGGWKHNTLKKGMEATLSLNPLKNGDPGGLLVQATLADGTTLGNGPGRGPATAGAKGKAKGAAK